MYDQPYCHLQLHAAAGAADKLNLTRTIMHVLVASRIVTCWIVLVMSVLAFLLSQDNGDVRCRVNDSDKLVIALATPSVSSSSSMSTLTIAMYFPFHHAARFLQIWSVVDAAHSRTNDRLAPQIPRRARILLRQYGDSQFQSPIHLAVDNARDPGRHGRQGGHIAANGL